MSRGSRMFGWANVDNEAHLQGQFGLRGGSPDLREKHTEGMPGTWQAPEAKIPHNTQAFHPAHCCLLQWQLPRTLKQGHLQSRCTSDAATTLQSIPKGHGPGAGAVSGLMSLKGKLCKPLRTPSKAAVPLAQIPQPHSPHCNGAEPTPKEFSSQLIMRSTSLTQRFHSNKEPILISNIKDAAKAARFGVRGFGGAQRLRLQRKRPPPAAAPQRRAASTAPRPHRRPQPTRATLGKRPGHSFGVGIPRLPRLPPGLPADPEPAAQAPQAAGAERSQGSGFDLVGSNGTGGFLSSASRSWQPRTGTGTSIQLCGAALKHKLSVMGSEPIPSLANILIRGVLFAIV